MRIHLVGVAGTGMGALAGLLRGLRHDVTGSDIAFDPPIGPQLEGWGISIRVGFRADHLDPAPDLVIVGNVCRRDNAEAVAAAARGIRVVSMPTAIAELALPGTSPLVVAGTHGKTTTSALCAALLDEVGQAPGFLIGGIPKNFGVGFRPALDRPRRILTDSATLARKVPFVIEGDEYDSAFFEKTPKFWQYQPEVAIITSIEHDHVDIFPDEAGYIDAFRKFVDKVPENGLIVATANDPRVVDVVSHARAKVTYFGMQGEATHGITPEWLAAPGVIVEGKQQFDLYIGGVACGRLEMSIPGEHNVRNAAAAIAAVAQGFHVPVRHLIGPLTRFQGVARRQDLIGVANGVRIYDDFAHHPTAVAATLAALKAKHPHRALWGVFEPRSATACRSMHQSAYAAAFGAADEVVLAPLGRAQIPDGERLDLGALVDALRRHGKSAVATASIDQLLTELEHRVQPGDTVAFLSNGAFGGAPRRLLASLEKHATHVEGPK